jgi:hypothetical protein
VASTIVFSGDDGNLDVAENYEELVGILQGGPRFLEVHPNGERGEPFFVSAARILYVRKASSGPFVA